MQPRNNRLIGLSRNPPKEPNFRFPLAKIWNAFSFRGLCSRLDSWPGAPPLDWTRLELEAQPPHSPITGSVQWIALPHSTCDPDWSPKSRKCNSQLALWRLPKIILQIRLSHLLIISAQWRRKKCWMGLAWAHRPWQAQDWVWEQAPSGVRGPSGVTRA